MIFIYNSMKVVEKDVLNWVYNRYAIYGDFIRNRNEWCLDNIGVIEID